jgi:hypothetical protein
MTSSYTFTRLGALLLMTYSCSTLANGSAAGAPRGQAVTVRSLCTNADKMVFSCPVAGGNKVISICAASNADSGQRRFYYAYGRPARSPDLVFPAKGQPSNNVFTRTHLGFAGNTGGYAYSFTNGEYKYVIYSISGTDNLQDGGAIVQRPGETSAIKKIPCEHAKITEAEDEAILDETLKWKSDPEIEAHGLPLVH